MTRIIPLCLLAAQLAYSQAGRGRAEVGQAHKRDVSRPLREVRPKPVPRGEPRAKRLRAIPRQTPTAGAAEQDPTVQTSAGPLIGVTNGLNFLGVGADFVGPAGAHFVDTAPPDPNAAAGDTQVVQWVNASFAVFDKTTGAVLYGPAPGNTLWDGFGGPCENNNDGDPIVQYDRAAGRWVLTQLAASTGPPYYQCIAVSTTVDATGAYNRYAFEYSNLNDYPKMAVWPDAYYFTYNMFQGTSTFLGAKVCAMDRAGMLTGAPATQQCFQLDPDYGALLPSDLDGATPPPAGSPNFLVGFAANSLNLWRFHVDFASPAGSTLTGPINLPVAAFNEVCASPPCVPQLGTSQKLDAIDDRLMYRLAYRNFGSHEAMVVSHTVKAANASGVRWYELRSPNTTPAVYQQGTYAPDSNYRWVPSIAMDKVGNIALGYSVSSGAMYPSIRFTGRAPGDPLGTLQAENSIVEGTGAQLPYLGLLSLSRWGDYTSLALDPTDDCTFWYTNQYLKTSGSFNWSTRVASFSFPSCTSAGPTPGFYLTVNPASRSVPKGSSTTYSITVNPTGGFTGDVNFTATGLPPGATASLNPLFVATSGSSTLTVTTSAATPEGSYPITVTATSGSLSRSTIVTLAVYTPASAIFVQSDTTTQGTWKTVYGADGYTIANGAATLPAYVQVTFAGQSSYTWSSSTTDVRALQKPTGSDRLASTWYSATSFTIDVKLLDGAAHKVAIYSLDWDRAGRAQTVELLDGISGALLDTRSVSSFQNGQWLLWNVTGHVRIRATKTAGTNAVLSGIFFDVPAVLVPDFSLSAAPPSQGVAQGSSNTFTVSVANSGGFNGVVNFSASGLPAGATAGFNPATITGSGTTTLTVSAGASTPPGSYTLTITGASGALTRSTTAGLTVSAPAAAAFVKTDATTQGTWKTVYGADGYAIANNAASYPAYAQVSMTGHTAYTWAASTTDARALQKAAASDRIASTWYSTTSFTVDLNFTDGASHQVAIYCLDWDRLNRTQTIDVLDGATGAVLDTRNLSGFGNGLWVVWNLAGYVKIRFTRTGPNSAVLSGLFFDAVVPIVPDFSLSASPASQTISPGASATYNLTVTPTGGFNGVVNFSATGLPPGAAATFTSTTMTVTTSGSTPGGSYPLTITGTSGSLTHTTTVTLVVSVTAPAAATFVKTDTSTQGTWKTVYGANGYSIANHANSFPGYALVAMSGQSAFTWAASTADVRALQKAAASDRIASTWYSAGSFTIEINLIDGNPHQVAVYSLDWDRTGRAQTLEVLDAATDAVLDTRTASNFGNGLWIAWNLQGRVKIRATKTAANNAVISGVFFDAPATLTPDFTLSASPSSQGVVRGSSAAYNLVVTPTGGFNGTVAFTASGLPAGASASFTSTTMTVTTTAATPAGSYPITITGASGSLSHSTTVTLVVSAAAAAATFVKTDSTTQGTWKTVYGANGYDIANHVTSYPAYAAVSMTGQTAYTWAASTTDVRALQKAAASDRIASSWYSTTSFTVEVNFADASPHPVGIYALDWDRLNRTQTVEVLDGITGNVLDTRTVSGFQNGQWIVWNLTGYLKLRFTRTGPNSAVLSGLFFD
jgi:hypothetical protein